MLRQLIIIIFLGTLLSATAPTQESVTTLYIATFDRIPDRDGLNYWVNESKLELEDIASSFFDQNETRKKYPNGTSNQDFINNVYTNLFNRKSDDTGLEYWQKELDNRNIVKSEFILAIINGALGNDAFILKEKEEISQLFINKDISKNYSEDVMNIYSEEGKESTIEMIYELDDTKKEAIKKLEEIEKNKYLKKITELLKTVKYEILKDDLKKSIISSVNSEATYYKAKVKADKLIVQYVELEKDIGDITTTSSNTDKVDLSCVVKGNISYNGGTKYYFLSSHKDYANVKINRTGEKCFKTEEEAKEAGWTKAPSYN